MADTQPPAPRGIRGRRSKMNSQINIYKNRGEWCYAMFQGGEFDHSDTIDCAGDATEQEVRALLRADYGDAKIERVADTNI